MVMIEPVSAARSTISTDEETSRAAAADLNRSNPSENKSTTSTTGYASDGFETASEGEVGDCDNNAQAVDDDGADKQQQQQQTVLQNDLSDDKDASGNSNELKEKRLAEANDAKLEGNKLFVDGQYEEALSQYELALQLAPEMPSSAELRAICHANRGTCYFKLGKYEDSVRECTKALELNPSYVKALVRRGEAHEKLEHYDEAIADMTKILEHDPAHYQAKRSVVRLEPLAREKREKMKEEMIGKLKDMGNSILGRFGMSVDNFKAVQDPNTGSYSVSFQN